MSNRYVFALTEINENDMGLFGNKAVNLGRLVRWGYSVPTGVAVSYAALDDLVTCNGLKETIDRILARKTNINKYLEVREKIKALSIHEPLEQELRAATAGLRFPLVVRSSSTLEDEEHNSYAGCFRTILHVESYGDLLGAVLQVWASIYTNLVPSPKPMGLVIEEYIDADYSGVVFTRDPVNGRDELVLEVARGDGEKVVSGEGSSWEIRISRSLRGSEHEQSYGDCPLPRELIAGLVDACLDIERRWSKPVDVEWAIKGSRLYFIQVRPITASGTKAFPKAMCFVRADDIEELNKYEIGAVLEQHFRWMDKRHWVRKYCLESGIRVPQAGYLFFDDRNLTEENLERVLFPSKIVKVVSEGRIRTIARKALLSYLGSLLQQSAQGVVRIEEITLTHACGNACRLTDGNLYIETIPGGFGGFISGELPFSWYIVGPSGRIVERRLERYTKLWAFNEVEGRFKATPVAERDGGLPEGVIFEIARMTDIIDRKYSGARIEWELEGNKVYLNDLSLEAHSLSTAFVASRVICLGTARGPAYVLSDLEGIKEIVSGRSVVAEANFVRVKESKAFREIASRYLIDGEKPIIIAPYPHPSLSLLTDVASGFIFERGGVLCHLGIILREEAIPAIILEGATLRFGHGAQIVLHRDHVFASG